MDDEIIKPEPPNMAWMLTFADLVSLLITFFVLLFSMKTVDESQWDVLKGTLMGVFAEETSTMVVHPDDFDTTKVVQDFPAESLPYLANIFEIEFKYDDILSKMHARYDDRADVLHLSLPSNLLFESGSHALTRQGKLAMMKLGDKLRYVDNRVQVSAHTSPGYPLVEGIPTLWDLTVQQAVAIAEMMHKRGMVAQVPAVGYADSRFETHSAQLSMAERYRQARRVDIEVFGDSSGEIN